MKRREHTSSAVEVSEVEDIGSAAEGLAASADGDLALLKSGSGDGDSGESGDDGEELHVDGWFGWFCLESGSEDGRLLVGVVMLRADVVMVFNYGDNHVLFIPFLSSRRSGFVQGTASKPLLSMVVARRRHCETHLSTKIDANALSMQRDARQRTVNTTCQGQIKMTFCRIHREIYGVRWQIVIPPRQCGSIGSTIVL